jgi:hypothetical protein
LEDWETKAMECFPDLLDVIDRNDSPLGLWIDLYIELIKAYEKQPINDDLIGRIYDYAAWCFAQPQTDDVHTDLSSATAVGLIESIPLDKNISADLYRWMSVETFEGCERLFRYHLSDEAYREFHDEFMNKKAKYPRLSRL